MRVLVTGGAGFIGSHIVDALLARGHEIIVVDDFSSGRESNLPEGGTFHDADIADGRAVMAAVRMCEPDAICHQAAQPSLRRSIDDPAHDAMVNIIGTINVIQAAKAYGAHMVFASTSAVYAGSDAPMTEAHHKFPRSPYGLAKLTAERYIELLAPSYTVLRYGNVYGPRQVQVGENQLIPHCLAHLFDGKPFVINGDGEQTRDFVYVEDIARANVLAIEQQTPGIFNCGTGRTRSVFEICSLIAGFCGWGEPFQHAPAKPGEARHVLLDSTRAAEMLGWRAETTLADGLRRTAAAWSER